MTNNNLTKFKQKVREEFKKELKRILKECGGKEVEIEWTALALNSIIDDTVDMTIEAVRLKEKKQDMAGFSEGKDLEEMYYLADVADTRYIAKIEGYNQAAKHQQAKIKKLKGER